MTHSDAASGWEQYLTSLAAFGMRPGLERVTALLTALGQPQDKFRAVHVVGTNGKSSTTRYTAAILQAHGLRSGAYLSPHISGFAERVLVDGQPIAAASFGRAVEAVRAEVAKLPAELGETTQFEVLTVAALLALAEAGVQVAAIEAGLGGRLDATNVLAAPVVVLTNVALEHTEVLGATRELIFAEKAAVIKGGDDSGDMAGDVVFGLLDGLEDEARRVCSAVGARPHFLGRDVTLKGAPHKFTIVTPGGIYKGLSVPSGALYQLANAALAVTAAELLLGHRLDEAAVRGALAATAVPGRLQVVGRKPLVLVDGAHNPDGMRTLLDSLSMIDWPRPRVAVLAVMRDKALAEMLKALVPQLAAIVCTQASESRRLSADELAEAVSQAVVSSLGWSAGEIGVNAAAAKKSRPLHVEVADDPHEAVVRARKLAGARGSVLITGSLYLLKDLSDLLAPPSA